MRYDAQNFLPSARHRLGFAAPVALALEVACPGECASGRLREQSRERLICGPERRRGAESEHQSANDLIAVQQRHREKRGRVAVGQTFVRGRELFAKAIARLQPDWFSATQGLGYWSICVERDR